MRKGRDNPICVFKSKGGRSIISRISYCQQNPRLAVFNLIAIWIAYLAVAVHAPNHLEVEYSCSPATLFVILTTMRAVRQMRGWEQQENSHAPPRTADINWERGTNSHPEYSRGGAASSLLYPELPDANQNQSRRGTARHEQHIEAAANYREPTASRRNSSVTPGYHPENDRQSRASALLYPDCADAASRLREESSSVEFLQNGRSQLLRIPTTASQQPPTISDVPPPSRGYRVGSSYDMAQRRKRPPSGRQQWQKPPAPAPPPTAPTQQPAERRSSPPGYQVTSSPPIRALPAPQPHAQPTAQPALGLGTTRGDLVEAQEEIISSLKTQLAAMTSLMQQGVTVPLDEASRGDGAVRVWFESGEWQTSFEPKQDARRDQHEPRGGRRQQAGHSMLEPPPNRVYEANIGWR